MKKQHFSKASNSVLGAMLMLGVLTTALQSSLANISTLMDEAHHQWSNFEKHLTDLNPHRTIFPN